MIKKGYITEDIKNKYNKFIKPIALDKLITFSRLGNYKNGLNDKGYLAFYDITNINSYIESNKYNLKIILMEYSMLHYQMMQYIKKLTLIVIYILQIK